MSNPCGPACAPLSEQDLHAAFVEIMPRIETHARIRSRHIPCPGRRDDFVSEAIALCWKWFVRAAQQGKDARQFTSALACLAVKAVRSGRRLCGQERSKEVMSHVAQRSWGFGVERLPSSRASYGRLYSDPHGQDELDAFEERLRDNTQTPVVDQAIFRADFLNWMETLPPRVRKVADALMAGKRTIDVARLEQVSPGRISQMRKELHRGWLDFAGD